VSGSSKSRAAPGGKQGGSGLALQAGESAQHLNRGSRAGADGSSIDSPKVVNLNWAQKDK